MDPNKALSRLRDLFGKLDNDVEAMTQDEICDLADEALGYFQGLDGWLSKGGFLPEGWSRSFDNRRLDGPPCEECGTFHKDCN